MQCFEKLTWLPVRVGFLLNASLIFQSFHIFSKSYHVRIKIIAKTKHCEGNTLFRQHIQVFASTNQVRCLGAATLQICQNLDHCPISG